MNVCAHPYEHNLGHPEPHLLGLAGSYQILMNVFNHPHERILTSA